MASEFGSGQLDYVAPESGEHFPEPLTVVDNSPQDIDVADWLASTRADATGYFEVGNQRLKIAALSDGEENRLLGASRRPNPKRPGESITDLIKYRRLVIAFSLQKASGKPVNAEELDRLPGGVVARLMAAIQLLSGHEAPQASKIDPFESLG